MNYIKNKSRFKVNQPIYFVQLYTIVKNIWSGAEVGLPRVDAVSPGGYGGVSEGRSYYTGVR